MTDYMHSAEIPSRFVRLPAADVPEGRWATETARRLAAQLDEYPAAEAQAAALAAQLSGHATVNNELKPHSGFALVRFPANGVEAYLMFHQLSKDGVASAEDLQRLDIHETPPVRPRETEFRVLPAGPALHSRSLLESSFNGMPCQLRAEEYFILNDKLSGILVVHLQWADPMLDEACAEVLHDIAGSVAVEPRA